MTVDLSQRISKRTVIALANEIMTDPGSAGRWIDMMLDSGSPRTAINAAWVLTHLDRKTKQNVLTPHGDRLIDFAMGRLPFRRGLVLSLLLDIIDSLQPRADFIDFCFSHITDRHEHDSCRAYMIHLSAKMCRRYPALAAELTQILDLITPDASPSLTSAKRHTLHLLQLTNPSSMSDA